MPATESHRTPEDVARLGAEFFERQIQSALRPEDQGKYIAIDVENGDYEIDADDYTAIMRLRGRNPSAGIWLTRAGHRATCRIGNVR